MATKLDRELEGLATMSREELIERWQAAYGCLPPAGARRELLIYAAGWQMQAKRLGGFSGEVRRMLRREVERIHSRCQSDRRQSNGDAHDGIYLPTVPPDGRASGSSDKNELLPVSGPSPERRRLVRGARLLRDWNGRTHVVDVVETGYLYDGTTYRSLSAIARRITGAHWSGPRFFGL